MNSQTILQEIRSLLSTKGQEALIDICHLLKDTVPHYHWVGFYFMNDEKQLLEIGPYAGKETEHVQIPFGKGICGQVAVTGETFTVQDVSQQDNYIACSIETKSEIVVPIRKEGRLIGQLDIDSHVNAPFTSEDRHLLEKICLEIGKTL